jgi:hypothetical protein
MHVSKGFEHIHKTRTDIERNKNKAHKNRIRTSAQGLGIVSGKACDGVKLVLRKQGIEARVGHLSAVDVGSVAAVLYNDDRRLPAHERRQISVEIGVASTDFDGRLHKQKQKRRLRVSVEN